MPEDAKIINEGKITVGEAGLVALVAPQVVNEGLIMAKLGRVQLALVLQPPSTSLAIAAEHCGS